MQLIIFIIMTIIIVIITATVGIIVIFKHCNQIFPFLVDLITYLSQNLKINWQIKKILKAKYNFIAQEELINGLGEAIIIRVTVQVLNLIVGIENRLMVNYQ